MSYSADAEARKFTVRLEGVKAVVMCVLGAYALGAVFLGIHIGNPDTSGYYGSSLDTATTVTAWVVALGGVLTAAFAAMVADAVIRWMKHSLVASLDIKAALLKDDAKEVMAA
jgi:hypothetical protein